MDWKKLLDDLKAAGLTQKQIADACGGSQASVSDLYRGECKSPSFDFGTKLVALHAQHCSAASQQEAA